MSKEKPHGQKANRRNIESELDIVSRLYIMFAYWLLLFVGYIRDFCESFTKGSNHNLKGYVPLLGGFSSHYTRHVYGRISDCWNRPLVSGPGSWIDIADRVGIPFIQELELTGKSTHCLNLGSYNYLGFSEPPPGCLEKNFEILNQYSCSNGSSRSSLGTSILHREFEQLIAEFLGKEDAVCFGMGFATNSTCISSLVGKGCLILSDSLNHASIAVGCRASGAHIAIFEHNDCDHLEKILRKYIVEGQPGKMYKPWKKIIIIVEGLFSMEGDVVDLPHLVKIKKKYKAYLYIDEAHSIGALGNGGRGVCEYWGVDPDDVDVLMGTVTKSFASCGGYIAASKDVIDVIRCSSFSSFYDSPMNSVCAQQAITTLRIIMGKDNMKLGKEKIALLRRNSIEFRRLLKEKGFTVIGDYDSPVIPVIIWSLLSITAFSRMCLLKNLAVVVVGFPATSLCTARARFCMSSSHSLEDLKRAADDIEQIGRVLLLVK